MTSHTFIDKQYDQHRCMWKWVRFFSVMPGLIYLLVLILTFGFKLEQPGMWIVERFSHIPYPVNFLLVAGGPIVSIMAHLILKLPPAIKTQQTENLDITLWTVALLCLITMCPFPWLWLAFLD